MAKLLLVDLCGTLYDSNTTFEFLHSFLSEDEAYRHFESKSKHLVTRIANRILPGDRRRKLAISYLKGYARSQLLATASAFLETTPVITEVRSYVDTLAKDSERTILVSSSLDFIVESACNILGFDGFNATGLGYSDDICDGAIADDLLGRKHILIAREYSDDLCTLVTDNKDDARCRAVVDRLVGVAFAGDTHAINFWKAHADEVIIYDR